MREERLMKEIALWRISRLFDLAAHSTEENGKESPAIARRYVILARKISTHYKVKIPPGIKNRMCKECNSILLPGLNCRVRIASNGFLVYICDCGSQKKIHLTKKSVMPKNMAQGKNRQK